MRWKGFITLIVIATVVSITGIFFLDNIIEAAIEKAGTSAWGARVEVEKVKIKWSPLGIQILGLRVASKKEEYKNLIDIKSLKVEVLAAPLLEKKLIIKEASGKGLAFNTERKTSGFLSKKVKEKREKAEKKWKVSMSSWMDNIKKRGREKIDVSGVFKKEDLQSLKAVKEVEQSFVDMQGRYSGLDELKINGTLNLVNEKIKALEGVNIKNAKDVEKAKKKIEEAQGAVKEADKVKNEINKTIKEFKHSVSEVKEKIKDIDKARKADYKNMIAKLKLPSIEMEDIAETVFGTLVIDKFKTISAYITKIRKYIPPKEEKEEIVRKPRKQGDDIIFTKEKGYPPLHLIKAFVSGENDARIEARDFTTTPWIIGKPAIINAAYADFEFNVIIDRTTKEPFESIRGSINNFKLAGSAGVANIEANFKGEKVDAAINWRGSGVLPPDWLQYLKLKDPPVRLTVKVYGKKDSPKFSIKSNLDKIISDQLKKELARQITDAKKKINSLLNAEVLGRKKKIESDINSFKSQKMAYLKSERKKIEDKKNELTGKVEAKKREAEELLEGKKREAEELLKKKKQEAEARKKEEEKKFKREAEKKKKEEEKKRKKEAKDKLKKLF